MLEWQLNVMKPDFQPKATEFVEKMISAISKLEEKKFAYQAEGNIMFDVSKFNIYGSLSSRKREEQIAGRRVKVATFKKILRILSCGNLLKMVNLHGTHHGVLDARAGIQNVL